MKTFRYAKYQLHGLNFYPSASDGYVRSAEVGYLVKSLYQGAASPAHDVVAYKGGYAEKKLLEELNIPHVNLEDFGVPVFQKSPDADLYRHFCCNKHGNCPSGWMNCTSCQLMFYKDCLVNE